jgi:osmotically-inducible protein OsmY
MISPSQPNRALALQIQAVAESRLKASPYRSIHKILCVWDNGLLVLQGSLPSYFQKQLAQEAVSDIKGVSQVINQIEVPGRTS